MVQPSRTKEEKVAAWRHKANAKLRKRGKAVPTEMVDPNGDEVDRAKLECDPIKVKGQNFVVFSFLIDTEEYRKNDGKINPYKDMIIKFSGAFKTEEQANEHATRLRQKLIETHPNKNYYHMFFAPMCEWSCLPNADEIIVDPENPEKVKPLVDLQYQNKVMDKIMTTVKTDQEAVIAEQEERIAETKHLGKTGKATMDDMEKFNKEITCNIQQLLKEETPNVPQ